MHVSLGHFQLRYIFREGCYNFHPWVLLHFFGPNVIDDIDHDVKKFIKKLS